MDYTSLEAMLGLIVFGPETDSLANVQYTILKLRQAAALLEYRHSVELRFAKDELSDDVQTATAATQQAAVPAKPKRKRGRPVKAANGAAHDEQAAPAGEPLFQTADSALMP